MQRIYGYPVYLLGSALGVLLDRLQNDVKLADIILILSNAQTHLDIFVRDQILALPLSKNAAFHLLRGLMERTTPEYILEHGQDTLSLADRNVIIGNIAHFQSVFLAELSQLDLYFVSPKRAYDMKKLIANAELTLPPSVIADLSPEIIADIREAGRCLAYEIPTACGFYVFRAIEAVVLMYFPVLGITAPQQNLGCYIGELKKANVDEKITGLLSHLKNSYRNPLMHPEISLSVDEADSLFQVAQSALTMMMTDIQKRRTASASPSPPAS